MPGPRNKSNRDKVISLREVGQTYSEIGRTLGITKERVRQIATVKPVLKPDLESKRMLTTGDVAQLLGVHDNTVRRWSQNGILRFYRINPRGDRRFRRRDVDDFLNNSSVGSI